MPINRQITTVIIISMGMLLLFTALFSYYSMNNLKNEEIEQMRYTLLQERRNQLRDVVQNAYSVLKTANFYEPAQAAISNMRFGKNHQNYFFVIDRKGMFWVNPAQPELVGKVHKNLEDVNGKRYIETIINNAYRSENSFIRYQVYKKDSAQLSTKLVHFKRYDKWNWIVCAGIYIDDIEELVSEKKDQIQTAMISQIKFFTLGEILALIISVFISTRFFKVKLIKPIEELTQAAEEMVGGNFDYEINVRSSREINQLVDAIQRMQNSFSIVYDRLKIKTIQSTTLRLIKENRDNEKQYELLSKIKKEAYRSAS